MDKYRYFFGDWLAALSPNVAAMAGANWQLECTIVAERSRSYCRGSVGVL